MWSLHPQCTLLSLEAPEWIEYQSRSRSSSITLDCHDRSISLLHDLDKCVLVKDLHAVHYLSGHPCFFTTGRVACAGVPDVLEDHEMEGGLLFRRNHTNQVAMLDREEGGVSHHIHIMSQGVGDIAVELGPRIEGFVRIMMV